MDKRPRIVSVAVNSGPLIAGGLALVFLAPRATFPPLLMLLPFVGLAAAGNIRVLPLAQGGAQTLIAAVLLPAMVLLGTTQAALVSMWGVAIYVLLNRYTIDRAAHAVGQRMVSVLLAGITWSLLLEGRPVFDHPVIARGLDALLPAVTGSLIAYSLASNVQVSARLAWRRGRPFWSVLLANAPREVPATILVGAGGLGIALLLAGMSPARALVSIVPVVAGCALALLYTSRRQAIREGAELHGAVAALLETLDLDELLKRLADHVERLVSPDVLGVFLRGPDGRYHVALARGMDPDVLEQMAWESEDRTIAWALEHRRPLRIDDYTKDPRRGPDVETAVGAGRVRSILIAPLVAGDDLLGALALTKSTTAYFTESHERSIATLAAQAALVVKNARLSQDTNQHLQRMNALQVISERINSQRDLGGVFSLIAESARDVLGADRCAIYLGGIDATPNNAFAFTRGLSDSYLRARMENFRRGFGLATQAIQSREPVIVTDVLTDPRGAHIVEAARREGIRTIAAFPLRYRDKVIGALRLYHDAVHPYEPSDVALAVAFASQAALAVENARLLQEAQHRAHQLGLVNRIVARVATTLRPEDLFETLVQELHVTLGYPLVALLLVKGDRLHRVAGFGYADVPEVHPMATRGVVGRVVRTGQAAFVEDVSRDPDYATVDSKVTQEACVPIFQDGRVAGLINVEVIEPVLTRSDLDLLMTLAGEVAEAMRNAVLFTEVREARDELQALHESAQALSGSLDLETILERLVSVTCRQFGYDRGAILLADPDGDLVVRAVYGDPAPVGERVQIGQGAEGRAARDARPVLVLGAPDATAAAPARAGGPTLAVPLMRENRVIGVFSVGADRPGRMGERDERILTTLARYAAVAIENAELYDETRRLATTDGLTGLVNHRALRQALGQQLERAKRYGIPLSVVMIEVDKFKRYNDTFGHLKGDEVLRLVARVLEKEHRRQVDVPCRYGGDEFVLLLPHTSKDDAAVVAERIRQTVEAIPFIADGQAAPVTLSVGVAAYAEDGDTTDALMDTADRRMYMAKRAGGNAVALTTAI